MDTSMKVVPEDGVRRGAFQLVGGMIFVAMVCETKGCRRFGDEINCVELLDCDKDLFFESHGQGGEDSGDFCPVCGQLGIATEAIGRAPEEKMKL